MNPKTLLFLLLFPSLSFAYLCSTASVYIHAQSIRETYSLVKDLIVNPDIYFSYTFLEKKEGDQKLFYVHKKGEIFNENDTENWKKMSIKPSKQDWKDFFIPYIKDKKNKYYFILIGGSKLGRENKVLLIKNNLGCEVVKNHPQILSLIEKL